MTSITVALTEDRLKKLKTIATRLGVAPEELVRASVEELLARPDDAFQKALEHVLKKNVELYQRLAAL